jgi:hypothetical protein
MKSVFIDYFKTFEFTYQQHDLFDSDVDVSWMSSAIREKAVYLSFFLDITLD